MFLKVYLFAFWVCLTWGCAQSKKPHTEKLNPADSALFRKLYSGNLTFETGAQSADSIEMEEVPAMMTLPANDAFLEELEQNGLVSQDSLLLSRFRTIESPLKLVDGTQLDFITERDKLNQGYQFTRNLTNGKQKFHLPYELGIAYFVQQARAGSLYVVRQYYIMNGDNFEVLLFDLPD